MGAFLRLLPNLHKNSGVYLCKYTVPGKTMGLSLTSTQTSTKIQVQRVHEQVLLNEEQSEQTHESRKIPTDPREKALAFSRCAGETSRKVVSGMRLGGV